MQAVRLAQLSYAPHASGALLRGLSRLVGRCAAGRRQSDPRSRDLYAEGDVGGHPARAAHAARHRLRAGQSAAGAASQRVGAGRTRRWWTARAPPHFDRQAYSAWLKELRTVCDARGIVLIFDEVFVGFRLAPGGAQEYFGVRADLVTYGKTLGGGLPVGVVCGRKHLMKRYRDDRPVDVCFARGTFNSHPYVMGAMCEFLQRLEDAGPPRALRQSRRGLERARPRPQSAAARRGPAGAGRQPVDHLDRHLHAAVALQLDAAVLPARRGAGAQLDRHRPPDLQPELHATTTSRRSPTALSLPRGPCIRTAGGGPTRARRRRRSSDRSLGEMISHVLTGRPRHAAPLKPASAT